MGGTQPRGGRAIVDPLAAACAAAILHLAEHNIGGVPSTANLDRARSLIEAMPDARLAVRLEAATWLAYAELSAEHGAEADTHFRRWFGSPEPPAAASTSARP